MENLAFLLKEILQEKHLLLWKISSFLVGKMEHVKTEISQPSKVLCSFQADSTSVLSFTSRSCGPLLVIMGGKLTLIIKSTPPHLPLFLVTLMLRPPLQWGGLKGQLLEQ